MAEWRWPHFSREEMECPCCKTFKASGDFMDKLEAIRAELGRSMPVNSGCRCAKHNKEKGGAILSSHLATDDHATCAVDIGIESGEARWDLMVLARKHGMRQLIVYNHFLHIACDHNKPVFSSWGKY